MGWQVKLIWLVGKLITAAVVNVSVELLVVAVLGCCWILQRPATAFANWFLDQVEPVLNFTERWLESVKEQLRERH